MVPEPNKLFFSPLLALTPIPALPDTNIYSHYQQQRSEYYIAFISHCIYANEGKAVRGFSNKTRG